jgi:hypothetical protein
MTEGHGGVVIGSGMSGGVRNVYVHDCTFTGGDRGIRLKSMRGRGGVVENVHFENVRMANIREEAIVLDMFYGSTTVTPRSSVPPLFQNMRIKNVTCEGAGVAVSIRGLPEQRIRDVVIENVRVNAIKGIRCQDIDDLTLREVDGVVTETPPFSCSNVRGLNIEDMALEQGGLS